MSTVLDLDPSSLADVSPWTGGAAGDHTWTVASTSGTVAVAGGALSFADGGYITTSLAGTWATSEAVLHLVATVVAVGSSAAPGVYLVPTGTLGMPTATQGWWANSTTAPVLDDGTIHLVTVSRDSSGTCKLWIDGADQGVNPAFSDPSGSTYNSVTLGAVSAGQSLIVHRMILADSAATLADDMAALVATYVSPTPEPTGAGTLGSEYRGPTLRAVLGDDHAASWPSTLHLGWLDGDGAELGTSRTAVANTSAVWSITTAGATNAAALDGGVAGGAWTIAAAGLWDAATGGSLVISCPLAEPVTVAADEALLIAADGLTITAA